MLLLADTLVLQLINKIFKLQYSRVHICSNKAFFKVHSAEMCATSYESHGDFHWEKPNNQKQKQQKSVIFQLRQFTIFFHENFRDWFLGELDKFM